MKIELIIYTDNNEWVNLDVRDTDITMTKTFSDLEDPSSIDAAYTLNCTLPFTKHNQDVLGNLYRLDYVKGSVSYDQREKYKCRVLHNEETIYEGDFVLDRTIINDDISHNEFQCTIYDEMYSMFKKLDYPISNPNESFDGSDKFQNINAIDTLLTPQLVAKSFKVASSLNDIFSYTNGQCDYKLKDFVEEDDVIQAFGFLPTYRKNDDITEGELFISNFQGTGKGIGWGEAVKKPTDMSPQFPHNIYPECLLQTWKAYNCKPYIYYSAYLQFIFSEIYRVTGYKVDMGTDFFKPTNPYYSNLIRTLKYPKTNDDGNIGGWTTISTNDVDFSDYKMFAEASTYNPATRTISADSSTRIHIDPDDLDLNKKYRIVFNANVTIFNKMANNAVFSSDVDARINKYCQAVLTANVKAHSNTSTISVGARTDCYYMTDCRHKEHSHTAGFELPRVKQKFSTNDWKNQDSYITFPNSMKNYFYFQNGKVIAGLDPSGSKLDSDAIQADSVLFSLNVPVQKTLLQQMILDGTDRLQYDLIFKYDQYSGANFVAEPQFHFNTTTMRLSNIQMVLQMYEEPKVSFKDFFGDDFNILERFTEFIKIFNLVCDLDTYNRQIHLYERGEYFNVNDDGRTGWQDKVEDWSKYINIQEDLEHTAILSDYKDLLYTYEDRDTANNTESRNESSYNAGTVKYDLALPVNTETKNYLEGLYNSYIGKVKGNWLYDAIIAHDRTAHPDNLTPAIYIDVDENGDALEDVDGQLLFRMDNNYLPSDYVNGSNTRRFMIVSDTPYEIEEGSKYMPYIEYSPTRYQFLAESDELPRVSIYYPKDKMAGTSYCSEWIDKIGNKLPNPMAYGVHQIWHKYWNDLLYGYPQYLVPSIKMTAYFHIPMDVYKSFDFSHLVMIENNLYLVLAIDEYCFGNEVMKATLIQLRGVSNLDSIDPLFGSEYLRVSPKRISLPKANTPKQFTYTVYSHNMSAVTATEETKPNWISTWSVIDTTDITPTMRRITVSYTTNSNYPTVKAPYTTATTYEDSEIYLTDELLISNVPSNEIDIDNEIDVTPTHTLIPNDTNANSIAYIVNTNVAFDTVTTNGSVITNFSYSVNQIRLGQYAVTVFFNNTVGQAGQTQTLTFSNKAGQTATATVERDFEHIVTVIPEKNGDANLFLLDYTNLTDPLMSEFHFYIKTNFKFTFADWNDTMYDHNQICWDKNVGDMELYESGNKVDWQTFIGQNNTLYHFYLSYPRKKGGNTGDYAGALVLNCIDGHPYRKVINVSAQIVNNNLH